MPELDLIIKIKREEDNNNRKFLAGIQGIDLGKAQNSAIEKRVAEVKRRAAVKLAGGEKELEKQEYADIGFGYTNLSE